MSGPVRIPACTAGLCCAARVGLLGRGPGRAAGRMRPCAHLTVPARDRIAYGDDPSQYGELYLPTGEPRGVVVVIHGGFWQAEYDAGLRPAARPPAWPSRAGRPGTWSTAGSVTAGGGGGTPATFDDVAAGIDKLGRPRPRPRRPWSRSATPPAVTSRPGPPLARPAAAGDRTWSPRPGCSTCGRRTPTGWAVVRSRPASATRRAGRRALRPDRAGAARRTRLVRARRRRRHRAALASPRPTSRPPPRPAARPSWCAVDGDHFVVIDPTSPAWAADAGDPRRARLSRRTVSSAGACRRCRAALVGGLDVAEHGRRTSV